MRFAPIILLVHFPATAWAVSCSYRKGNTGEGYCAAFEMDCESADKTKASSLTTTHNFAPYPFVPSMEDLMFYKTFAYEFKYNNITLDTKLDSNQIPIQSEDEDLVTSSPDGNVTGVCTKSSKITWQVFTANSSTYFVCSELNNPSGGLWQPTACCDYIYCDDGGKYVDASSCTSWSVPVTTVPEASPVVFSFQIEQSKSGQTDCISAGGKTYLFRPALLGMTIAALSFLI